MPYRTRVRERCAGAALLAALSCTRFGYESLPAGVGELEFTGARDLDAGIAGSGGTNGGGGASGSGASGSVSDADAAATGAFGGDGSSSVDAGSVTVGGSGGSGTGSALDGVCGPALPTATWDFGSDAAGWDFEADPGATAALSWTSAAGDPAPGALQLDSTVNSPNNVRVQVVPGESDFTGKVIYARVFLASGSGVSVKVFVQTGPDFLWADGYQVDLAAQEWSCVMLDAQDPEIIVPGADFTQVRRIGIMVFGNASSRLYVDHVTY